MEDLLNTVKLQLNAVVEGQQKEQLMFADCDAVHFIAGSDPLAIVAGKVFAQHAFDTHSAAPEAVNALPQLASQAMGQSLA